MTKKKVSIVSSCYNEEENLWELYDRVTAVMAKFPELDFEFILADNGSTDHTQDVLKALAEKDHRIKIIINSRNFGPDRSGYHLLRQATGDCVTSLASDLQNPPEILEEFIKRWQVGHKVVIGVKNKSKENPIVFAVRKVYYRLIRSLSDVEMIDNFTGFGLYDRSVSDIITAQSWPAPYFRGMVCEVGFEPSIVYYTQDKRKHGKSSYSFLRYYDTAMTGITSFSNIPLRIMAISGFVLSVLSFIVAVVYFILKLIHWDDMPMGFAPLTIGVFFFSSIQILCIGIVGEYIMQIFEHVKVKPLVVEKERIGFDDE
jgi:glycosyltransferase involved in cell wall biosynthesis